MAKWISDGILKFETKIDTSGLENGIKSVKVVSSEATNAIKDTSKAIDKLGSDGSKAPPKIKEKLKDLPFTPGVYLMKDKDGKIIYVGRNYFTYGR